ncbi:urease accessory protein UreD [Amycolatopsis magusensis]|uniref:urease accessory protein UreD n=1 Tax=Amycolatopsis magusensis TaxID=882444 RepID=UPI0024A9FC3C|nr:urease accessory protein UreD [Amycolatopsis magusensis]MDI5978456.1 urease accessory protein UreD [Amycolatopsis magusensis]
MKATARLVAELGPDGRTVLRELRSMAPLTLFPRRRFTRDALVHLVNSATSPLGGDELRLLVRVGAGARLTLSGVAATLALPGPRGEASSSIVDVSVEDGGWFSYLPEPTVVTARARHIAELHVSLAGDAAFRAREVLVLGREGESPGRLTTTQHVVRDGRAVLRQTLDIGDPALGASLAYLAGRRVLATEILLLDEKPVEPTGGEWWSVSPLAGGGALVTALADSTVEAERMLTSG